MQDPEVEDEEESELQVQGVLAGDGGRELRLQEKVPAVDDKVPGVLGERELFLPGEVDVQEKEALAQGVRELIEQRMAGGPSTPQHPQPA